MNAQTAKITPGPWVVSNYGAVMGGPLREYTNGYARSQVALATMSDAVASESIRDANAALIAEAGTVANETGLTPQQLADQRAELLEALRQIVTRYVELVNSGDCGSWNPEKELEVVDARSAIQRATGEQP